MLQLGGGISKSIPAGYIEGNILVLVPLGLRERATPVKSTFIGTLEYNSVHPAYQYSVFKVIIVIYF